MRSSYACSLNQFLSLLSLSPLLHHYYILTLLHRFRYSLKNYLHLCILREKSNFHTRFENAKVRSFAYSYFEKGVGKNVHTAIRKGNMGYDRYNVPDDCSCRPCDSRYDRVKRSVRHADSERLIDLTIGEK